MAHTPVPVVLTRAPADAGQWTEALQAQHFNVLHLPLITVSAAALQAPLSQTFGSLARYTALMFVSANAARFFFEMASAADVQCLTQAHVAGSGPRCWAPGPGTAAELRRCGVPAHLIDQPQVDAAQFDSEALWQQVARQVGSTSRVLVVRGDTAGSANANGVGRQWLTNQCQSQGATVDVAVVYQRTPPTFTTQTAQLLEACAQTPDTIWLASSSEGLLNLQAMIESWAARPDALYAQRLVVTHPRIGQRARQLGWLRVFETKPALPNVLQTLAELSS